MSMKNGMWSGLLLAAALWPATSAAADAGKTITGPEMVRILQDAGYRAKLDKDEDGDPRIETKMSGMNVYVSFYDCKQDRCGSLQFAVALDLADGTTLEAINDFNASYRYVRAHLDDEMDPFLRFDFEVLHTDHTAHIASQIDLWEDVLGAFLKATGSEGEDEGLSEEGSEG